MTLHPHRPRNGRMAAARRSLAGLTTFGVGGAATSVVELPARLDDVREALAATTGPLFVLGHGSNVLVADEGYDGTIVLLEQSERPSITGATVLLDAATPFDSVVEMCAAGGLRGLERLAGIPGTIGGAVVQNAGAYGQAIGPLVREVACVDRLTGETVSLTHEQCAFAYRDSVFKAQPDRWVIVSALLELVPERHASVDDQKELLTELGLTPGAASPSPLTRITAATRSIRGRKDHLVTPDNRTAGSFFQNVTEPLGDDAVSALEETFVARREQVRGVDATFGDGLSLRRGGDGPLLAGSLIATAFDHDPSEFLPGAVHDRVRLGRSGPNTLINAGSATASDVLRVARRMRDAVLSTYGVALQSEVVLVGCTL